LTEEKKRDKDIKALRKKRVAEKREAEKRGERK